MLLNSLLHDPPAQSPVTARRECLKMLSFFCSTHPDLASAHVPKIIAHIVRRIKDPCSDSSVRDSCKDAVGSLSSLYLRGGEKHGSMVSAFVKPFLEALGEQNKVVQGGAASCLAKIVECAGGSDAEQESGVMAVAFQKLCPRICKLLGSQSFLAKGALLAVVSSLSQVKYLKYIFKCFKSLFFHLCRSLFIISSIPEILCYLDGEHMFTSALLCLSFPFISRGLID